MVKNTTLALERKALVLVLLNSCSIFNRTKFKNVVKNIHNRYRLQVGFKNKARLGSASPFKDHILIDLTFGAVHNEVAII